MEKAATVCKCMSSYNKVRQNAAHTRIALLTATFCIGLKSSSRQSPYLLWQLPIYPDSSFLKKGADECLGATRRRDHLCKYWGGGDQSPPIKSAIQSGLCGQAQRRVSVPQGNHHICIDSGGHCPLIPRNHFVMPFLPDGISRLPMPRYFENALLLLTGRTRMPFPSLSKSSLSPLRTPRTRRTSRGTVICPLLVMVACFCIVWLYSLLYNNFLTRSRPRRKE